MTPALPVTRETLLDATAALLAEGGLSEATTQKVARRAGVAEGTIYRHFLNKEALVDAVFERAWVRLDQAIRQALPPIETPGARLRAFLGATLEAIQAHPEEAGLLRQEFAHLVAQARGGCPVPAGSGRFIGILEETLRHAQAAGEARPGLDPAASALFAYNGLSKTWATLPPGPGAEALFRGIQGFLDAAFFP